ncbi:hypothetical protein [Streptococcus iniae]|uniref:Uncharacterized protein n=1 Tax=Streptococcus iniae TaxID=1346 RepID=A0A3L8G9Y0_STRIN|nr:hypothetical protein [Streptococcus iniae]AGM99910.1 hypothetical protein K710_2169 [Streptococcus iniae SF1]AHY16752.1 hypothetical protein DQ08_10015 [Streptococcus iniae]AHY18617.1 hypothetical protein DW64_10000 [Streptococcus iniae]AJG26879.1 hypothetical protein SI82_09925 [Streptococcus iniae]APD32777.1 hypothetical protein BMF34_09960 [Streptococcus iniae]
MVQFIRKYKNNFIWILLFGIAGIVFKVTCKLLLTLLTRYPRTGHLFLILLFILAMVNNSSATLIFAILIIFTVIDLLDFKR